MYWREQSEPRKRYMVPDDIVDLSFRISCRSLPLDHAHGLSTALHLVLPWLEYEEKAGVHLIHGAESGNGWMRPEAPEDILYLSRRTRMTLRLPKGRVADAKQQLKGRTLNIDGSALTLGEASIRMLSPQTTIFARYVISNSVQNEMTFLAQASELLAAQGIRVDKMMGGRTHVLKMPDREIMTRSLMIDSLEVEASVRLQQQGLGPGRKFGCGLFLPHKGIDAVKKVQPKY